MPSPSDPRPWRGRRLTAWQSLAVWAVVALVAWLDAHDPAHQVHVHTAWIAAVVSVIVTAFGYMADAAVTVAITIAQAAAMIAIGLAHFAIAIGHVFVNAYGFLAKFWGSVLKPFVQWSWKMLQNLHTWLKETFGPLIEFLNKVRDWIDRFYDTYIRPINEAIDITRKALQLLDAAHVEFAEKIDRALAALEDKLTRPILEIRQYLNEAINLVNSVIDGFGLFKRVALLASLARDMGGVVGLWWQRVHRALSPGEDERYRQPLPVRPVAAAAADAHAYIVRHDGPDAARIDEHAADLTLRLSRLRAGEL